MDDRYRVVLDKEIRDKLKVEPGDHVLAIPSTEGIAITSLKGKKYQSFHPGFNFKEEDHGPQATFSETLVGPGPERRSNQSLARHAH